MNPTGTEARVCADIAKRQLQGIAKYGTTVEKNPLGLTQWLQHAYEECLDQAVYLKRALEQLQGVEKIEEPEMADVTSLGDSERLYVPSDHVVELEDGSKLIASAGDPHADLRKQWKPGQRWQYRIPGAIIDDCAGCD